MTGAAGWNLFSDPRFPLRCRYPGVTPAGKAVELREREQPGILRAHLVSPESTEVYFEITRFSGLTAGDIYQRHRLELEQRFADLAFMPLEVIELASRAAQRYFFSWQQVRRAAYLVDIAGGVYRILYNPDSQINEQILTTLEWIA